MGAHTKFFIISRLTITMSSNQEEEAGPSGVSPEETLTLLGLDMSDNEEEEENLSCSEVMENSEEEDELCNEIIDCFEPVVVGHGSQSMMGLSIDSNSVAMNLRTVRISSKKNSTTRAENNKDGNFSVSCGLIILCLHLDV